MDNRGCIHIVIIQTMMPYLCIIIRIVHMFLIIPIVPIPHIIHRINDIKRKEKTSCILGLVFYLGTTMQHYKQIENGYEIILGKEFYERETIFAVAYKYNHRFLISISPWEDNKVLFVITKKETGEVPAQKDVEKILSDFIDKQLQIDILKKTQNIRDAVYRKAFSPIERD